MGIDFLTSFWDIMLELSPYLLLGLVFAGLLNGFVSKSFVIKHLGGRGLKSAVKAALIGVPLPLCSCGVIPTGIAFHNQGASKGATVSFLISTPQTGVDSILATYSMMNLPWAIFRPIIAFITGIVGGWLVKDHENNTDSPILPLNMPEVQRSLFDKTIKYAFVDFLQDISRPLVAGIIIATLLTVFIPDWMFTEYLNHPILNMLIILIASTPLYVCATGSVPIAAALLAKGLSPGAALVFLMAGPATNAATITVLWKTLGKRTTIVYVGTIVVCSMFFGLCIDYLFPSSMFMISDLTHVHNHNNGLIPPVLGQASAVILSLLLIFVEIKKIVPMHQKEMKSEAQSFMVEGMTCNHCKASVENAINSIEGVSSAVVDLNQKTVRIEGAVSEEDVKESVEKIGYEFKGVKA